VIQTWPNFLAVETRHRRVRTIWPDGDSVYVDGSGYDWFGLDRRVQERRDQYAMVRILVSSNTVAGTIINCNTDECAILLFIALYKCILSMYVLVFCPKTEN